MDELWPLVARLEARVAMGHCDRDIAVLLAWGQMALGVSLGTVLPEERLAAAARCTGKALLIAERLEDPGLLALALRMHGNELRKAGRMAAAIARLGRAVRLSRDREGRASAYALLARATGEHGNAALFDHAVNRCRDLLDGVGDLGMVANPFSLREIRLRGLITTGRVAEAANLLRSDQPEPPAAPQWHVIERVTAGQVHLAASERDGAVDALGTALAAAEPYRLPHQVQRAIRIADATGLAEVAEAGRAVLRQLITFPMELGVD